MLKTIDFSPLKQNWSLRLIALLIGTILWYVIVAEDQVDMTITVPLEMRNLPTNMIIANQYKKDLEVAVRGPKRLIQEMQQQNISRPINMEKAIPGRIIIRNTPDSIPVARGITVQRVQPTNTMLLIDVLIQKTIPIVAQTTGKLPKGYTVAAIQLIPDTVTVSGSRGLLSKIDAILTTPINLDGLIRTSDAQPRLLLNEPLLQLVGETVVEAKIVIQEPLIKKTVKDIPINLKNAGTNAVIDPATVTVEASIPSQVAAETPELNMLFRASANLKERDVNGQIPIRVESIVLPDHTAIRIHSIKPNKAQLSP